MDPRTADVAVLLAVCSAATFGIADFLGGLATRRVAAWSVVVGSQAIGLIGLVLVLPVLPSATASASDIVWGAAAGVGGALALTQFYRALALGPMSVAAPVTAVVNAIVPVGVGVALGERPQVLAWIGIAMALPAIALASTDPHGHRGVTATMLRAAVLGGVGFGIFFVFLDRTGSDSGLLPLVAARVASVGVVFVLGQATGKLERISFGHVPVLAGAGVLDVTANALFLLAVRRGLLALGGVIGAMYPVSTIILARVVLGERLAGVQWAGLLLAGAAVGFVALA